MGLIDLKTSRILATDEYIKYMEISSKLHSIDICKPEPNGVIRNGKRQDEEAARKEQEIWTKIRKFQARHTNTD
uniref:Uncharacterized protein n=1 Tax=viral metagenome TaxID=1070528 RepID=A0A6M3J044_9ZZZZ